MLSCWWCHDWWPTLTQTGVGPGVGANMLCTGLLVFRNPPMPLSREWLFSRPWTGVTLWSRPSCWMYPPTPPMPPPPLPADPWDEWLNQRQRSLSICFTSNSFFPDILLWVWRRGRWYTESQKTWIAEGRRALIWVLTVWNVSLLFRYFHINIMTAPPSFFYFSCVVLLEEIKSSPLQLLFSVPESTTLPPTLPHCFSPSISLPCCCLLVFAPAAAAAAAAGNWLNAHTWSTHSPLHLLLPPRLSHFLWSSQCVSAYTHVHTVRERQTEIFTANKMGK